MLELRAELDFRLYERLEQAAMTAENRPDHLRSLLTEIVRQEPLLDSHADRICEELDDWFDIEAMTNASDYWPVQAATRDLLESQVAMAVAQLAEFVEDHVRECDFRVTVHIIPGFRLCYGPAEGTQLFGLRTGATPAEALLFLVHVYCHELCSLFYSEASRRAAAGPADAAEMRDTILLLVQNEGLANHVVLEPVLDLRARGCAFAYFTYADLIGDASATASAMRLLRKILIELDDENWRFLQGRIATLLKDPRLPTINLVGIHVAEVIAAFFGEDALFDPGREPAEFFRMYADAGDPLSRVLLGESEEFAPAIGLEVRGGMA